MLVTFTFFRLAKYDNHLLQTAYNLIQREVVSVILPVLITNSQDSGFILKLWHQNAELVLWGILNAQNLKSDGILRIIEIFHELKVTMLY